MYICYTEQMRILIVQSRTDESWVERERENYRRTIGNAADIEFLSTLDEKLAWTSPDEFLQRSDGMIFGGSSDFDFHGGRQEKDPARLMSLIILSRARNIVQHALAEHLPVFGVCFGHQIIAQMHGGDVRNDTTQGKHGSHEVVLTDAGKEDILFGHLPPSFHARYFHKDAATTLPTGATLLASGVACHFSALRYGKNTYTVQFHPEARAVDEEGKSLHDAARIIPLWIEHIAGK